VSIAEASDPRTGGQEVTLTLTGDGFLYRMVRVVAAALVEVGQGRLSPEDLEVSGAGCLCGAGRAGRGGEERAGRGCMELERV
jgi:hypothetical protein